MPAPTPPSSDRWPSRPTHKRPIAQILTGSPSLLPQQSLAMLWMPAGASQLRDSLSLSGARSNRSNKGAIRRHLRPQSGSTSGASSRWEEAGRGAEGQAGSHIRDELAIETGLSGRRRRPHVRPAPCAPSADEFRRGCSAYRHSGHANWLSWPLELFLRGFPFGNDIMPARSAAVDLYSSSLPPRHRATVARWRGGKEEL